MTRSGFYRFAWAITTWSITVLAVAAADGADERPNILLILTDDQGYWDLGVHGNQKIDTPNLDRLAADSVRFDRFYVQPVCSPTRAGLMTGRYYLRTGVYNTRFGGDSLALDEITIAQLLKQAGYRTGLFGKWHLGRYAGYRPHERGFDEFLGHYQGHIEQYDYPSQLVHNGRPVHARGYVTDLFTDAAIDFITATREQPWFCYLSYNAPHSPFVVGASHDGMPEGDELIKKYLARDLPLRDARIYAMCEIIDRNVGRLLARLDELNLSENTVVVFLCDNGGVSQAFKAGLRGAKGSVFEGGVRSPLFVRWPGRFSPRTLDALTSHVDLFPTFCELAGVSAPDDRRIDGRSLVPLLSGRSAESPHEYVYHTWNRHVPSSRENWAISDARWKLCAPLQPGSNQPPMFLFDLANDPGERTDVARQHPEVLGRLHSEWLRWWEVAMLDRSFQPVPIPVGHPDDDEVELQASWAVLEGESIRYTFRGYDWDTIEGWRKPGESATWKLDVQNSGDYEVTIYAGCGQSDAGGALKLSSPTSSLNFKPRPTPTADVFTRQPAGRLRLDEGVTTLKAEVARAPGRELMRMNSILLRRIE